MILLAKDIYEETLALKEGKLRRSLLLDELSSFVKRMFGIHVANFSYGPIQGSREKRLLLIADGKGDCKKIITFENGCKQDKYILMDKFEELCEQYGHPNWRIGDQFFVCYCDFLEELSAQIMKQASYEIRQVPQVFPMTPIWEVYIEFSQIHIFYDTDKQVEFFEANGTNQSIERYCKQILSKYDSYGVYVDIKVCTFVSHQMLIEQYEDNMFYYTRR